MAYEHKCQILDKWLFRLSTDLAHKRPERSQDSLYKDLLESLSKAKTQPRMTSEHLASYCI
jgi:hypothetical protein